MRLPSVDWLIVLEVYAVVLVIGFWWTFVIAPALAP